MITPLKLKQSTNRIDILIPKKFPYVIQNYLQEYSEAGRNKQLEQFIQMSLLHQSEKSGSNGSIDPIQIQHQQQHFISQFQRNVSNWRTMRSNSLGSRI